MIQAKTVLVLSLLVTLLLSRYCKTSASTDIPPSTFKPPSQTLPLEEGRIRCPKTQDINAQIKRRARIVPFTPNVSSRQRSRSSSAMGKQISSLQFLLALLAMLEQKYGESRLA
ncbi:hypothetical protein R3W88_018752 [Solanum pinnatisectum]|uniref:Secreted protein n=1 Tax=Solanum pinnatisectum TaxID=50273 RepID=A0AAV9KJQ5_9SOLN|nr:hypothetical protein R3W88_018752 [Solanum pinnatisectum]